MSDKNRKRYLKAAFKAKERETLQASMPLSKPQLRELFDYLDRPECPACDHTLKETTDFLRSRALKPDLVVPWLREHGGFCDCEVLANVENEFEQILDT